MYIQAELKVKVDTTWFAAEIEVSGRKTVAVEFRRVNAQVPAMVGEHEVVCVEVVTAGVLTGACLGRDVDHLFESGNKKENYVALCHISIQGKRGNEVILFIDGHTLYRYLAKLFAWLRL